MIRLKPAIHRDTIMVTLQISVSDTAAQLIERTVREKQFVDPSEYIEGLIEADHAENLDIDSELLFVGDGGITEPSRATRRTGACSGSHPPAWGTPPA